MERALRPAPTPTPSLRPPRHADRPRRAEGCGRVAARSRSSVRRWRTVHGTRRIAPVRTMHYRRAHLHHRPNMEGHIEAVSNTVNTVCFWPSSKYGKYVSPPSRFTTLELGYSTLYSTLSLLQSTSRVDLE